MKCRKKITALILAMMLLYRCFSCIEVFGEEITNAEQVNQQIENTHILISEESVTTPEGIVTTSEENVTTPESIVTTPESIVTTPESIVTTPESIVTTPESIVTTPESIVTTPESIVTTLESIVTTPEGTCNVTIYMGNLPNKIKSPKPNIPKHNPLIKIKDKNNKDVLVTTTESPDVMKEYGQYKIAVEPGTYSYEVFDPVLLEDGYDENDQYSLVGAGAIDVIENDQKIYLRRLNFSVLCEKSVKKYFKEVQLEDSEGKCFTAGYGSNKSPIIKVDKGPFYQASFVVPALGENSPYFYEIIPKDEYKDYWHSKGKAYVYPDLDEDNFQALNLSDSFEGFVIAKKADMKIKVPHGAELKVYHRVKFYRPEESIDVGSPKEGDYDVYDFKVPERTELHYEVRQKGKVTQAKTFGGSQIATLDTITVSSLKDNPKQVIRDIEKQGMFDANILMNVPDSKYLQLQKNESFELSAFRNWQAVQSITGNYYVEPDYHYEVAYGDSVTVSKDGIITADKPGVSVIHVTYDALEYETVDSKLRDEDGLMVYSAIFPENTGVIVVNVNGNNEARIYSNIKQSEYDRIYFAKSMNGLSKDNCAEYRFKPTVENGEIETVSTQTPLAKSIIEGWNSYKPDSDGYYTIKLYEGRNIVKIRAGESVLYYVLTAQGVDVKIQNMTHPGQPLTNADKAKISFEGLHMPFPKLAAVYNPGYGDQTWIQYDYDGARVDGIHTQYNITTENNSLEIYLDTPGNCHLTNGSIHTTSIGDTSNSHRAINKASKSSNYTGGDSGCNVDGYFCILPDIEFQVEDAGALGEKGKFDLCSLNGLQIISTNPNITSDKSDVIILSNSPEGLQNYIVVDDSVERILSLNPMMSNGKAAKVDLKIYKNGEEIPNSGFNKEIQLGKLESNPTLIELVVIPKNPEEGYQKTYAVKILPENYQYSYNHRVYYGQDIGLDIVRSSENNNDSKYRIRLENDAIFEKYGWGFISTLNNEDYIVTVPYDTKEVYVNAILNQISKTGNIQLKSETILVNDEQISSVKSNNSYITTSKPIAITGAETVIKFSREATYDNKDNTLNEEKNSFSIKVKRTDPPKFLNISSSEGMIIKVNDISKFFKTNDKGLYELEEGKTYNVIAVLDGYISKVIPYKVTSEDNQTLEIKISDLEKTPTQTGTTIVNVMGYNRILRAAMTISIGQPEDLALQKYVDYNHGGYTALHALIDAFNTGISKVSFSCYKGVLTPKVDINKVGLGSNAGWVCEVNGKACNPATTLVNNGDQIDFYYNPDYAGMKHAWFDKSAVTVSAGNSADVTLVGTSVNNDGSAARGVEGATIKVNGAVAGVTNSAGGFNIPTESIKDPGEYTVTAEKIDNGKNILTYAYAIIKVRKADVEVVPGKTTVSFRLIGDAKHNGISKHGTYVTWIATKKYTFEKDSVSVYDVFTTALDEAGLSYVGANKNYVSKIQAPKAYGGYWLGEFSNGHNSGWMYTVNGSHPELGLKDCYVTTGDVIIWHYVDDYTLETSFEGSVPSYPNRWLEAKDENPPTDGTVIDMSNGNLAVEQVVETGNFATGIVTAVAKVDANGRAVATIVKSDLKDVLEQILKTAKEVEAEKGTAPVKKLIIDVSGTEKASSVETTIQRAAAVELSSNIDIVIVKTSIGEVTFDKASFASMVQQSTGDLKFTIKKEDSVKILSDLKNISDADKEKIRNRPIFEFNAETGGKKISEFSGDVSVKIPYEKAAEEKAEALVVYWLQDSGKLMPMLGGKLSSDGKYVEMTTKHWSNYVIGYNEVNFTDSASHWAKLNITYLAARDVIKGKNESIFAPNSQITRAEFVQILANLSGADLAIYNEQSELAFNDVTATAWYAKAVAWAVENGIAGGTGNDMFSPNANITRQDMSVMISKYAANVSKETLADTNKALQFADDYEIASYAKEAVTSMQKAGIINGVKNNLGSYSFNPKANATRAEATTMIANYIKQ